MPPNQLTKPKDIIWRQIGDEVVVIRDDGLSVNILNKTAAFIWEMCTEGRDASEIVARLCERFAVDSEMATEDVSRAISKLKETGLLKQTGEVAGR